MVLSLGYWKIRGLAAGLRMAAHYCGVQVDSVTYEVGDAPAFDRSCWFDVKFTLGLNPFSNLPYLIDSETGVKITETLPILRYIARQYGGKKSSSKLLVDDPYQDMLANRSMDLRNSMVALFYLRNSTPELIEEKKVPVATHMATFDTFFKESGRKFCGGDELSYVDFFLAEHVEQLRILMPELLAACPDLSAYLDRFLAIEEIQEFRKSPLYMEAPINNKSALFGGK